MESLELFTTSPQSRNCSQQGYLKRVAEVARWSEEFGYSGILVYTDNGIVDPWLVAQIILQSTERLSPLVAIQPVYMHPYTVAKMVTSLAFLHHRRVYLNMLAGGFKNDLLALNDSTPHDQRYQRTTEYTLIIRKLLETSGPVTFEGSHYRIKNLKMQPSLSPDLFPGFLISGSSAAGMEAVRALGATAVKYPGPDDADKEQWDGSGDGIRRGIRVGIVARPHHEDAWAVARERFPVDRRGQITHQFAMKTSDSFWHRQLSAAGEREAESVYWLEPFRNYHTFCPYLVGRYDETGAELARYIKKGVRTFILDIPPSSDELEHARQVFDRALEAAT